MKKFLPVTAAALVALGGTATALTYAPQMNAAAAAVESDLYPASVPDSEAVFTIEADGSTKITVTFTTPTQGGTSAWAYQYEDFPEGFEFTKVVVYRNDYTEWIEETVAEYENIGTGQTITFIDPVPFVLGRTYNYNVVVYNGEKASPQWGGSSYVYAGVKVAEPEYMTAKVNGMAVDLSVTCADGDGEGGSLQFPLNKLQILRAGYDFVNSINYDAEVIKTWENPVAGQTYTYTDTDVKEGVSYTYYADQACEYGVSSMAMAPSVSVGLDAPQVPSPITATMQPDGSVLVQWTPNPVGSHRGEVDLAEVEYEVYRYFSYSDTPLVATVKGVDTYVDDLAGIDVQTKLCWQVVARNPMGSSGIGSGTTSNELVVGPAPTLPYIENFDTRVDLSIYSNHIWVNEMLSGTYNGWMIQTTSYWYDENWNYYDIYPVEYDAENHPEGGMALLYCNAYGNSDAYYISAPIELGTPSNPVLSFYYYCVPGASAKLTLDVLAHHDESGIEPLSDEEEEVYNVWESTLGDVETEGWQQAFVHLNGLTGLAQLRFRGEYLMDWGNPAIPICIDNICLADYKAPENLQYDNSEAYKVTLTWEGAEATGEIETPDDPVLERDGSKEHPYNVEDVLAATEDQTGVWIVANIVGTVGASWSEGNVHFSAEDASNTNLVISDLTVEAATMETSAPVQLPKGAARDGLNLAENPGNLGKTVLLKGNLQKYFGQPGVKSVTEYEFLDYGISAQAPAREVEVVAALAPKTYVVTCDGVVIANPLQTTYTTGEMEPGTYIFGVYAIYAAGNEEILTPEAYVEAIVLATGVESVETFQVVGIEYYDLSGVAIETPARGQVVVRKATLSNGKTVVEKTVVRK